MIILGLTGGIATGKSTVSKRFKSVHNLPVVDADVIARQVVEPGTSAYRKIVNHFGSSILLPDGHLDRPALGRVVFNNEKERQFLNSVVHPAVRKEMLRQVISAYIRGHDIVILDVPLLFESNLARFCSKTVVVTCDDSKQFERLRARDPHLSEEDARSRIAAQFPMEKKEKMATYVIDNNGSLEQLYAQVDDLVKNIRPNYLINMAEWLGPPVITGLLAALLFAFKTSKPKL